MEWLRVLLRWAHIIAAIMWIGDSLLFMWIDSHLSPDPQSRKGVAGVTWLLHSGGYYQLEKRALVPGRLPPRLRWFWLEATTTWISGFLLLILIYYVSADAFMVDRSVSSLTSGQAVAVGLSVIVGSWLLYDGLWRLLENRPLLAAALTSALLLGVVYFATHLLSARAAFLHVGAMLGTIMAANVWVHIALPQRRMMRDIQGGRQTDRSLEIIAKTRSTHNTYLTFPVIFLMLSNHFPAIYASRPNWLVMSLFIVFGAGVRHLMLVGFRAGRWTAGTTAIAAAALVYLMAPAGARIPAPSSTGPAASAPSFVEVRTIIVQRCAVCHSETPTMPGFAAAPVGTKMDTPEQIVALAPRIKVRAVEQKTMPLGNVTHVTDEERATLGRWIDAGAPLK